ncbi:MAG TPA: hypothetical protein VES91_04595 [Burkholderiaceae bacterium]|nr:hypothetical protein [Burkholderiaceae bacterium]
MKEDLRGRSHGVAAIVALLSTLAFLLPAQAADPPAKKPAAKQTGKSKQKPMSRDQLRACMDQQDRLLAMRENVLKEQTSLDQQRAEVARMDAELARKRTALDPADTAAKQALTAEEVKRNDVGDAYNARLPTLKEQGATLDKERQSWVERCADKDFDELDELAIKRERQRAAKAAGKVTPAK